MANDWICGKGLAAHSPLPKTIGVMLAAMAEMLDMHTRALDLTDTNGRTEYAAYASLIAQQRMTAASLSSMTTEMSGYESLPMASHDTDVLSSPEFTATFETLVATEIELLEILLGTVAEHQKMLQE